MENRDINRVKVDVGGSQYTLCGQEPKERLLDVADMVNDMMRQVAAANPKLDSRRVAVLTALNVADLFYKLRDDYEQVLKLLDGQPEPLNRG